MTASPSEGMAIVLNSDSGLCLINHVGDAAHFAAHTDDQLTLSRTIPVAVISSVKNRPYRSP